MNVKITQKLITEHHLAPRSGTLFIRDSTLQGFGLRITSTGTIAFITEGRIRGGKPKRITIGQYPVFSIQDAKAIATQHLQLMRQGIDPEAQAALEAQERQEEADLKQALGVSLGDILDSFFRVRQLKPKTEKDYKNTIGLYFQDWLPKPLRDITRQDAEDRFFSIQESAGRKGTGEKGKATATKAMRILSSVFNYAKAEIINGTRLVTENPVEVLKDKRVDRSIKRRDSYLIAKEVVKLLQVFSDCEIAEFYPGNSRCSFYHAIALIIFTGLRRDEAFSLKWEDVFLGAEVPYFRVIDTKNDEIHYVPLTKTTKRILNLRELFKINEKLAISDPYVFPAFKGGTGHILDPRKTLNHLAQLTGKSFTIHDLRRTFATKAQEVGLDMIALKRLLNHKRSSKDVTEGYVINHHKDKLLTVRGYLEKIEASILSDEETYWPTYTTEELFS